MWTCVFAIVLAQPPSQGNGFAVESPPTNRPIELTIPTSLVGQEDTGVPSSEAVESQPRLHTNPPPVVNDVDDHLTGSDKKTHWDFSWNGWDGLHLGIVQETPWNKTPREMLGLEPLTNVPSIHLEQIKLFAKIGGLLEGDGAGYHTDGNLNLSNGAELRRARLHAQGDCILLLPVSYMFEVSYVPQEFYLNRAWISFERMDYIGSVVIGYFAPPMGLDLQTSSRDISFMEPATVLQAIAPGNEAGIQIGHPIFDQRGTWALGIFGGGLAFTEYGNASEHYGNLMGRVTYLAIDHLAPPDRPEDNQLLHLGLSANVQYAPSRTIRYRSRPESHIAEYVIDTGDIKSDGSVAVGAEAAYVKGSFSMQGEFIDSVVRQDNGDGLNFYGFYAHAGWYLTGESPLYDPVNGEFKRLVPRRNFDFGRGGDWGAFEVAARFSYTDLSDGDINGGRVSLLMGELNWYLHSHVRWMFNAGGGHVTGGPHEGNLLLFQTRVGIDF